MRSAAGMPHAPNPFAEDGHPMAQASPLQHPRNIRTTRSPSTNSFASAADAGLGYRPSANSFPSAADAGLGYRPLAAVVPVPLMLASSDALLGSVLE